MSIYALIASGRKYMQLWPERIELLNYFPQYRAVALCRMQTRYFPLIALLVFALTYVFSQGGELSLALFYFTFIASMPLQGLLLLGKQSQDKLPPALASWFRQGVTRLKEQSQQKAEQNSYNRIHDEHESARHQEAITKQLVASMANPLFMDLARLLNITYQKSRF